ncbi:hypothetical protein ACLI09_07645 [Flavobacterium sp. RHBU_24]|uniref:hypothetical protein n=1 Tax=Flavobacterium sp. RHBU_24 TaxID=3391185 RepID=UPI003985039D
MFTDKLNFESDLKFELIRLATQIGFKLSMNNSLDKMLVNYLNVHSKLIQPKLRNVKINPEFIKDIFFHTKRKEIEHIFNLAKIGGNLNPFQSKKLLQTNFHDHLKNEWNIYHFHLSLEINKKSGFVKQVDSLLFAYIDNENVFFLGESTHKQDIFSNIKWVEILHDHFPKILEPFKREETDDIKVASDYKNSALWRERLCMGFSKIRNTVYYHPGIGQATSGHNILIVRNSIGFLRWLHKLENQVADSYQELCIILGLSLDEAKFKIRIGEETLELIEEFSNHQLVKYPEELIGKEELIRQINSSNILT